MCHKESFKARKLNQLHSVIPKAVQSFEKTMKCSNHNWMSRGTKLGWGWTCHSKKCTKQIAHCVKISNKAHWSGAICHVTPNTYWENFFCATNILSSADKWHSTNGQTDEQNLFWDWTHNPEKDLQTNCQNFKQSMWLLSCPTQHLLEKSTWCHKHSSMQLCETNQVFDCGFAKCKSFNSLQQRLQLMCNHSLSDDCIACTNIQHQSCNPHSWMQIKLAMCCQKSHQIDLLPMNWLIQQNIPECPRPQWWIEEGNWSTSPESGDKEKVPPLFAVNCTLHTTLKSDSTRKQNS